MILTVQTDTIFQDMTKGSMVIGSLIYWDVSLQQIVHCHAVRICKIDISWLKNDQECYKGPMKGPSFKKIKGNFCQWHLPKLSLFNRKKKTINLAE